MICPNCKIDMKCIESRQADIHSYRRRRYKCQKCGNRFTTHETFAEEDNWLSDDIVKKVPKEPVQLKSGLSAAEIQDRLKYPWKYGRTKHGNSD
jgi:transcriptional regulator NrdR family protein